MAPLFNGGRARSFDALETLFEDGFLVNTTCGGLRISFTANRLEFDLSCLFELKEVEGGSLGARLCHNLRRINDVINDFWPSFLAFFRGDRHRIH